MIHGQRSGKHKGCHSKVAGRVSQWLLHHLDTGVVQHVVRHGSEGNQRVRDLRLDAMSTNRHRSSFQHFPQRPSLPSTVVIGSNATSADQRHHHSLPTVLISSTAIPSLPFQRADLVGLMWLSTRPFTIYYCKANQ